MTGRALCARLDAVAREKGEVDLQRCFFKFTMDSITEIAFAEKEHVGGGPSFGELFDDAHRLLTYLVPAGFLPLTAIGMLQPSWLRNAALYARRKVPRNARLQRKRLRLHSSYGLGGLDAHCRSVLRDPSHYDRPSKK